MATNRADTLDPALLRPGRLDRKIEFPEPNRRERRLIFQTVTNKMNLGPDVDLEDCTSFCYEGAELTGFQMYRDRTSCHPHKLLRSSKRLVSKVNRNLNCRLFF